MHNFNIMFVIEIFDDLSFKKYPVMKYFQVHHRQHFNNPNICIIWQNINIINRFYFKERVMLKFIDINLIISNIEVLSWSLF